jgi:hypothetical protein
VVTICSTIAADLVKKDNLQLLYLAWEMCGHFFISRSAFNQVFVFFQGIRKEVLAQVEEAVEFALAGSELPTPELYTHVYVDQGDQAIRGCDPFTWNTNA